MVFSKDQITLSQAVCSGENYFSFFGLSVKHNTIGDIVFDWQVKQERALQEQASTYLQLVCSACDLSEARVRETAAAIQQIKLQVIQL